MYVALQARAPCRRPRLASVLATCLCALVLGCAGVAALTVPPSIGLGTSGPVSFLCRDCDTARWAVVGSSLPVAVVSCGPHCGRVDGVPAASDAEQQEAAVALLVAADWGWARNVTVVLRRDDNTVVATHALPRRLDLSPVVAFAGTRQAMVREGSLVDADIALPPDATAAGAAWALEVAWAVGDGRDVIARAAVPAPPAMITGTIDSSGANVWQDSDVMAARVSVPFPGGAVLPLTMVAASATPLLVLATGISRQSTIDADSARLGAVVPPMLRAAWGSIAFPAAAQVLAVAPMEAHAAGAIITVRLDTDVSLSAAELQTAPVALLSRHRSALCLNASLTGGRKVTCVLDAAHPHSPRPFVRTLGGCGSGVAASMWTISAAAFRAQQVLHSLQEVLSQQGVLTSSPLARPVVGRRHRREFALHSTDMRRWRGDFTEAFSINDEVDFTLGRIESAIVPPAPGTYRLGCDVTGGLVEVHAVAGGPLSGTIAGGVVLCRSTDRSIEQSGRVPRWLAEENSNRYFTFRRGESLWVDVLVLVNASAGDAVPAFSVSLTAVDDPPTRRVAYAAPLLCCRAPTQLGPLLQRALWQSPQATPNTSHIVHGLQPAAYDKGTCRHPFGMRDALPADFSLAVPAFAASGCAAVSAVVEAGVPPPVPPAWLRVLPASADRFCVGESGTGSGAVRNVFVPGGRGPTADERPRHLLFFEPSDGGLPPLTIRTVDPAVVAFAAPNTDATVVVVRGSLATDGDAPPQMLLLPVDGGDAVPCLSAACDVNACSCLLQSTAAVAGTYRVAVRFTTLGEVVSVPTLRVAFAVSDLQSGDVDDLGGTLVTIAGARFAPNTAVLVGANATSPRPCAIVAASPTRLVCITPPANITALGGGGPVAVAVVHAGVSVLCPRSLSRRLVAAVAVVASVEPRQVSALAAPTFWITGQNLEGLAFRFCDAARPAYDRTCIVCLHRWSDGRGNFTCTVPQRIPAGRHVLVAGSDARQAARNATITSDFNITRVEPHAISAAGGASITLTGYGFVPQMRVDVSGQACAIANVSNTGLVCTIPRAADDAIRLNQSVVLSLRAIPLIDGQTASYECTNGGWTTAAGAPSPCLLAMHPDTAPSVSAVAPLSGQRAILTISGWRFTPYARGISFSVGTTPCRIIELYYDRAVCALEAYCEGGLQPVSVAVAGVGLGVSTAFFLCHMGLTAIEPAAGSVAGGVVITIFGFGFPREPIGAVGDVPCAATTTNGTAVFCTAGPLDTFRTFAGVVSVRDAANSVSGSCCRFTYDVAYTPLISAITPTSGTEGTRATLVGRGFLSGASVTINNVVATGVVTLSSAAINLFIPRLPGLASRPKLWFPDRGHAWAESSLERFTFPLTIARVVPERVGFGGGAVLTISGSGFTAGITAGASLVEGSTLRTEVRVCGLACRIDGLSYSEIMCALPRVVGESFAVQYSAFVPSTTFSRSVVAVLVRLSSGLTAPMDTEPVPLASFAEAGPPLAQTQTFRLGLAMPTHARVAIRSVSLAFSHEAVSGECELLRPLTHIVQAPLNESSAFNTSVINTTGVYLGHLLGRHIVFDVQRTPQSELLATRIAQIYCTGVRFEGSGGLDPAPTIAVSVAGIAAPLLSTGGCPVNVLVSDAGQTVQSCSDPFGTACAAVVYTSDLTPLIRAVSPASGLSTGDATAVTIKGEKFGLNADVVTADIGSQRCTVASIGDDTLVCLPLPPSGPANAPMSIFVTGRGWGFAVTSEHFVSAAPVGAEQSRAVGGEPVPLVQRGILRVRRAMAVLLDVAPVGPLEAIVVEGTLVIADVPMRIVAACIVVLPGGVLRSGSTENPRTTALNITLTGRRGDLPSEELRSLVGPSIARRFPLVCAVVVVQGTLQLTALSASHISSALRIAAAPGDTSIEVSDRVSWSTGQQIVLGSTGLGAAQQEVHRIRERVYLGSSSRLVLEEPVRLQHSVHTAISQGTTIDFVPLVAVVGRLITIEAPDGGAGGSGFGASVHIHAAVACALSNVIIRGAGKAHAWQAPADAAYALHVAATDDFVMRNSVVFDAVTAGIIMENCTGPQVRYTTVASVAGVGIGTIGGGAVGATISNCIVMRVSEGTVAPRGLQVGAAAYLLTNGQVSFVANTAMGTDGHGILVDLPLRADTAPYDCPRGLPGPALSSVVVAGALGDGFVVRPHLHTAYRRCAAEPNPSTTAPLTLTSARLYAIRGAGIALAGTVPGLAVFTSVIADVGDAAIRIGGSVIGAVSIEQCDLSAIQLRTAGTTAVSPAAAPMALRVGLALRDCPSVVLSRVTFERFGRAVDTCGGDSAEADQYMYAARRHPYVMLQSAQLEMRTVAAAGRLCGVVVWLDSDGTTTGRSEQAYLLQGAAYLASLPALCVPVHAAAVAAVTPNITLYCATRSIYHFHVVQLRTATASPAEAVVSAGEAWSVRMVMSGANTAGVGASEVFRVALTPRGRGVLLVVPDRDPTVLVATASVLTSEMWWVVALPSALAAESLLLYRRGLVDMVAPVRWALPTAGRTIEVRGAAATVVETIALTNPPSIGPAVIAATPLSSDFGIASVEVVTATYDAAAAMAAAARPGRTITRTLTLPTVRQLLSPERVEFRFSAQRRSEAALVGASLCGEGEWCLPPLRAQGRAFAELAVGGSRSVVSWTSVVGPTGACPPLVAIAENREVVVDAAAAARGLCAQLVVVEGILRINATAAGRAIDASFGAVVVLGTLIVHGGASSAVHVDLCAAAPPTLRVNDTLTVPRGSVLVMGGGSLNVTSATKPRWAALGPAEGPHPATDGHGLANATVLALGLRTGDLYGLTAPNGGTPATAVFGAPTRWLSDHRGAEVCRLAAAVVIAMECGAGQVLAVRRSGHPRPRVSIDGLLVRGRGGGGPAVHLAAARATIAAAVFMNVSAALTTSSTDTIAALQGIIVWGTAAGPALVLHAGAALDRALVVGVAGECAVRLAACVPSLSMTVAHSESTAVCTSCCLASQRLAVHSVPTGVRVDGRGPCIIAQAIIRRAAVAAIVGGGGDVRVEDTTITDSAVGVVAATASVVAISRTVFVLTCGEGPLIPAACTAVSGVFSCAALGSVAARTAVLALPLSALATPLPADRPASIGLVSLTDVVFDGFQACQGMPARSIAVADVAGDTPPHVTALKTSYRSSAAPTALVAIPAGQPQTFVADPDGTLLATNLSATLFASTAAIPECTFVAVGRAACQGVAFGTLRVGAAQPLPALFAQTDSFGPVRQSAAAQVCGPSAACGVLSLAVGRQYTVRPALEDLPRVVAASVELCGQGSAESAMIVALQRDCYMAVTAWSGGQRLPADTAIDIADPHASVVVGCPDVRVLLACGGASVELHQLVRGRVAITLAIDYDHASVVGPWRMAAVLAAHLGLGSGQVTMFAARPTDIFSITELFFDIEASDSAAYNSTAETLRINALLDAMTDDAFEGALSAAVGYTVIDSRVVLYADERPPVTAATAPPSLVLFLAVISAIVACLVGGVALSVYCDSRRQEDMARRKVLVAQAETFAALPPTDGITLKETESIDCEENQGMIYLETWALAAAVDDPPEVRVQPFALVAVAAQHNTDASATIGEDEHPDGLMRIASAFRGFTDAFAADVGRKKSTVSEKAPSKSFRAPARKRQTVTIADQPDQPDQPPLITLVAAEEAQPSEDGRGSDSDGHNNNNNSRGPSSRISSSRGPSSRHEPTPQLPSIAPPSSGSDGGDEGIHEIFGAHVSHSDPAAAAAAPAAVHTLLGDLPPITIAGSSHSGPPVLNFRRGKSPRSRSPTWSRASVLPVSPAPQSQTPKSDFLGASLSPNTPSPTHSLKDSKRRRAEKKREKKARMMFGRSRGDAASPSPPSSPPVLTFFDAAAMADAPPLSLHATPQRSPRREHSHTAAPPSAAPDDNDAFLSFDMVGGDTTPFGGSVRDEAGQPRATTMTDFLAVKPPRSEKSRARKPTLDPAVAPLVEAIREKKRKHKKKKRQQEAHESASVSPVSEALAASYTTKPVQAPAPDPAVPKPPPEDRRGFGFKRR